MANPNIIPYLHYQDIQIPDVATQTQFKTYWNQAKYVQAINLLTSSGLRGKAYLAEVINTLTNGVGYMEGLYDTDVTGFLASALNHYQFLIDSFKNRYVWNASVGYVLFNFVTYNGEVYMALGDVPVGTLPTDDTYWLYLSVTGEAGADGADVNLRYAWDSTATYVANDLVTYGNKLYVAIDESINITPGTDASKWLLFVDFDLGTITVSTTAPADPYDKMIWFSTQAEPTTTTETIGTFKLYDEATATWIDMYPLTALAQIPNGQNILPRLTAIGYTIETDEWNDSGSDVMFEYSSPKIKDGSVVKVMLQAEAIEEQIQAYQTLGIQVEAGLLKLTSSILPTVSLPIIILIQ